ncbi:hypothetical protein FRB99_002979 [Tulasnella sp. 403]|nr:hypothetical protein FRB99_002979 [Tulasnella sp. 403]
MAIPQLVRRFFRKAEKQPSNTWDALQSLIQLADAVQIPITGDQFGIPDDIVDFLRCHDSDRSASRDLLDSLLPYSESLWEFLQHSSTPYIKDSDALRATFSRTALAVFRSDLGRVFYLIKEQSSKRPLRRIVPHYDIKVEIVRCGRQLEYSHKALKARPTHHLSSTN